jgi:xanthosine utilization system XapX-like protein
MTDTPWKYAPTRGELKFWLVISTIGLCLAIVALMTHGIPYGPAFFEVVALPGVFLGYLFVRSVKRLIRREHP